MRTLTLVLVLVVNLLVPPLVKADTTYYYTGNPFTSSQSFSDQPLPQGVVSFTGSFTISGSLPDIIPFPVTPLSFSFTDGATTIDQNNASFAEFFMFADSSGNLVSWLVDIITPATSSGLIQIEFQISNLGNPTADATSYQALSGEDPNAENNNDPGTWSTVPPVVASPEPPTVLLLASGVLIALIALRKQVAQP